MNPLPAPPLIQNRRRSVLPWIFLGLVVLGVTSAIWAITSVFRLSTEARHLRSSVKMAVGAQADWREQLELSVGRFTCMLLRTGLSFAPLEPEARAAVRTLRGAEAGIYRVNFSSGEADYGTIQAAADQAMAKLGWGRLVGVANDRDLVLVYVSEAPSANLKACVAVLSGEQLVVASGTSNVDALVDLVAVCARRPEVRRWRAQL